MNVDAKKVEFMGLFSAQRISEKQSASRPSHLQWWLAQVEKNKTDREHDPSDKVSFVPDIEVVRIPAGTLKRLTLWEINEESPGPYFTNELGFNRNTE